MGLLPAHQHSHKEEPPGSPSWNTKGLSLQRRWFSLVLCSSCFSITDLLHGLSNITPALGAIRPCLRIHNQDHSWCSPTQPRLAASCPNTGIGIRDTFTGMKRFLPSPARSAVPAVAHRQRHLFFSGEQEGALLQSTETANATPSASLRSSCGVCAGKGLKSSEINPPGGEQKRNKTTKLKGRVQKELPGDF